MINLNKLKKQEILDRYNFRCKHRHNGMSHSVCYEKARKCGNRIGFLDIESGGSLDADWGFVFCYRIKALDGPIIKGDITSAEIRAPIMGGGTKDKNVVSKFCKDVWNFDTLVVYYGKDRGGRYQRHDIPFLRTRAMRWGVKGFPLWHEIRVIDVFDIVSRKTKLSKRSMANACRLFGIHAKGLPFNVEVWQDALAGHQKALTYIGKHCDQDVVSLEDLYKKIIPYMETSSPI